MKTSTHEAIMAMQTEQYEERLLAQKSAIGIIAMQRDEALEELTTLRAARAKGNANLAAHNAKRNAQAKGRVA